MYALIRTSAPSVEPVTLAELKSQTRVDTSDENTLLETLIQTAREHTEAFLSRSLVQQTWRLDIEDWPDDDMILLRRPPIQSITSVQYYDTANAQQTLSSSTYLLVGGGDSEGGGYIKRAYNQTWPSVYDRPEAISVTYVAGYAPTDDSPVDYRANIPRAIRHAILMLAAHLFENREASAPTTLNVTSVPMGYESLLWPYRWWQ